VKRIAVMTSGGDAAGMNPALRAVVRSAIDAGVEIFGIRRGFAGLCEGDFVEMSAHSVSGILQRGGTILRTFRHPQFDRREVRDAAAEVFHRAGFDGLIIIGGDGSFRGGHCIDAEWNVPVIGVPGTIDNDIPGTDYSIGYDTALNIAVDAVDKIRDTATSHGRIFVVEVMGRNSGMLAVASSWPKAPPRPTPPPSRSAPAPPRKCAWWCWDTSSAVAIRRPSTASWPPAWVTRRSSGFSMVPAA